MHVHVKNFRRGCKASRSVDKPGHILGSKQFNPRQHRTLLSVREADSYRKDSKMGSCFSLSQGTRNSSRISESSTRPCPRCTARCDACRSCRLGRQCPYRRQCSSCRKWNSAAMLSVEGRRNSRNRSGTGRSRSRRPSARLETLSDTDARSIASGRSRSARVHPR